MNIKEAVEDFLLAKRADGVSSATIKWYESILSSFTTKHEGTIENVTRQDMRKYIVSLQARDHRYPEAMQKPVQDGALSPDTIESHKRGLHAFWRWAAFEYEIDNPMQGIKRKRHTGKIAGGVNPSDFMTLVEATYDYPYLKASHDLTPHERRQQWLNTQMGYRDRAILFLFADSGARLGSIQSIDVSKINFEKNDTQVIQKGAKHHKLRWTNYTALAIDAWLSIREKKSDALFTNINTGARLTSGGIYKMLERLKHRTGITGKVNPHRFRHNFAREYLLSGGDLVTLARLLGHSSIQTTADYYAIFSDDELAELQAQHSPLLKMLKITE